MKAIVTYACALFMLCACQKEVFTPKPVKEKPHEVVVPQPEPEPEPEPQPEPELEPESENVRLRDFPNHFTSAHHYRLVKAYTDSKEVWDALPAWAKDDIHTFNDFGDGTIVSSEICPKHPFQELNVNWSAYGDDIGVRLDWVDTEYNPVSYVVKSMNVGKSFTVYFMKDGEKVYLQFALTENK